MIPEYTPVYKKLRHPIEGKKYVLISGGSYHSERYGRMVHLPSGFLSDGATGAMDIKDSWSWWVHDWLCEKCVWDDGTPCSALDASMVLYDILDEEGREIRKFSWKWATFLFGSWKIKKRVGWVK